MTLDDKSILVVSRDMTVSEAVKSALSDTPNTKIEQQGASLAEMNGKAASMVFQHDLVIFEANLDDEVEMGALNSLLQTPQSRTKFLAVSPSDISHSKARILTQAGVSEVLSSSLSISEFREIIQDCVDTPSKAPVTSHHKGNVNEGAVIAVSQARGGIGATTVAVNLASLLVGRSGMFKKTVKRKVALVDLDIQFGNAGVFLDIEDRGAMVQLATSVEPPDSVFLQTAMIEHPSGLHVLTAPFQAMPLEAMQPETIAALITVLRQEYEYVVIDMPRAMVNWIEPVLMQATKLLIVAESTVPAVRQARRLIDFYTEDNLSLPVEIVVNREKRPSFLKQHHKEAAKALDRPLSYWLPRDDKAARNAVDRGIPLVDTASGSGLAKAFRRLADETIKTCPVRQSKTI